MADEIFYEFLWTILLHVVGFYWLKDITKYVGPTSCGGHGCLTLLNFSPFNYWKL